MPGVAITGRGLTREYPAGERSQTALDHVDIDIAAGSLVAITGPSGSGKSTLLHVIGGMDILTSGTLRVGETQLDELPPRKLVSYRRRVGFVFQRFHLLPALTAADNVAAPLLPYQAGKALQQRALTLLEQVGLGDRGDALPSQLSGGEQQRVAIARALIVDPPLLLADEPTGNLDSATGATIFDLLIELHSRTGATLLVATHDPAVDARCDVHLGIRDGKMEPPAASEARASFARPAAS
ncbi:MAG TPA: ABC transporter ATP-binding protein [Candidatus Dormibacteraeota bacterium]